MIPRWALTALVDTLVEHLRTCCVLLVLDNCEHLLAECADFVDTLLRACPSLTILTTSRAPLGVPGEITWRVPSMSLPTEPAREPIESLLQFDAVSLFIDRAQQVRPNFAVTASSAPAVAQICQDLDGIPLAFELAAARVRMMAPEQISRGLSDRFHLLTGGARTVMPRQQTLQASLDWSYELLSEDERTLLRRLSAFAGGWTLDAAEQVCSGEDIDRYAVLDLLTGLVDKSLVTTQEHGPETRYGLLETVRQYVTPRLAQAGELEHLRGQHLAYYLTLAQTAEPQVLGAGRDDPVLHSLAAYPKSRAGRRIVPLPGFVITLLTEHQRRHPPGAGGLVFTSRSGAAVRRTTFRAKVWRPSLVRAGLLGKIVEVGPRKVMAHWHDGDGRECSQQFPTAREATEHLITYAHGGLRFHDLCHSYATWLGRRADQ